MVNQIDPRTQYILYKEREKELELSIERRFVIAARGEMGTAKHSNPWYIQAAHWLKDRSPFHAFQKQMATEPVQMEEPCPGLPC